MVIKNKRGWLRIMEAGIAVLIILATIVTIAITRTPQSPIDLTPVINDVLEEIATNTSLRSEVLRYDPSKNFEDSPNKEILSNLELFLEDRIKQKSLEYRVQICKPEDFCYLEEYPDTTDVYTAERILSVNIGDSSFSPKKIKIFMWRNIE